MTAVGSEQVSEGPSLVRRLSLDVQDERNAKVPISARGTWEQGTRGCHRNELSRHNSGYRGPGRPFWLHWSR